MPRQQIGKIIREARLLKGLSQEELAGRIGIKAPSLSNVESGRVMPTVPTLLGAIRELQIPTAALLPFIRLREDSRRAAAEATLVVVATDLSDQEVEIAVAQIRAMAGKTKVRSRVR